MVRCCRQAVQAALNAWHLLSDLLEREWKAKEVRCAAAFVHSHYPILSKFEADLTPVVEAPYWCNASARELLFKATQPRLSRLAITPLARPGSSKRIPGGAFRLMDNEVLRHTASRNRLPDSTTLQTCKLI